MATARHFGPALDIEGSLAPLLGRSADLLREGGHGRWCDNALALLQGPWLAQSLIVQSGGRIDGLGDPIKRYRREQFILGESALDLAVAITPGPVLFDDPGRQPGWRVIEPKGQRLRFSALDVGIASFSLQPGLALL